MDELYAALESAVDALDLLITFLAKVALAPLWLFLAGATAVGVAIGGGDPVHP